MSKVRISKKTIYWFVACLSFLLIAFLLLLVRNGLTRDQITQQMADRWSETSDVAQISMFFTKDAGMTKSRIVGLEHALDSALQEASITVESENPGARLWADAYSANGKLMVSTDRASMNLTAIGVGGDFFQFHPLDLEYGNFFSDKDLNHDYVVIDEEIAWQLFGGINVPGKVINVNGAPHVIAGVIRRPKGKPETAAGLGDPIIYVSMETLEKYAGATILDHFEIVMPNPIKGFAMNMLKENLMLDEREVEYVENTTRFSLEASLKVMEQFGFRSMHGKAIIYPYWENLARRCEDILAFVSLFMVLFFAVPAIIVFVWLIYRWKHKKWTFRSVTKKLSELAGRMVRRSKTHGAMTKESRKKESRKKESQVKKAGKRESRTPIRIDFNEEEKNEKE